MKKRNLFLASVLVLTMSLTLVVPVSAAEGYVTTDCEGAYFWGTIADGELGRLEVRLHDTSDWQSPILQDDYIVIGPGSFDETVPWVAYPDGRLYRAVFTVSTDGGQTWTRLKGDEGIKSCPPPPDVEGCTPGYWKNHFEDWPPTGYSPSDGVFVTFGVDLGYATLGDAIFAKGGHVNELARHGTAALLSAAHPNVNYPYTKAEVIAFVQAGDADPLVAANELDCQLP